MSTAEIENLQDSHSVAAEEASRPLPLRHDTILGVCEAIGQDLGFNPNWLRIPFAALILWNPTVVIGCYLILGCVVAGSRWLYPAAKKAAQTATSADSNDNASKTEQEKELLAA